MDMDEVSVLVVEVENSNFVNFTQFVKEKKLPYKIKHAQCIEEVKKYLDLPINVIIIDAKLKEEEIFEIFHIISEDIFSIILIEKEQENIALEAIKNGAIDYILKAQDQKTFDELTRVIEKITKEKSILEELQIYRKKLTGMVEKRIESLTQSNQNLASRNEELLLIEKRALHSNAVLAAIRNITQVIVRYSDVDKIIQKSCEYIVKTPEFSKAWLILYDENFHVTKAAQRGLDKDFSSFLKEFKKSGNCRCICFAPKIIEFPTYHCLNCPLSRTYQDESRLAVPLKHKDRIYGYFSVAISKNFQDIKQAQNLLEELASDIAFGLYNIESKKQKEEIEKKCSLLATAVENLAEIIFITNIDGTIEYVNPAFENITGYTKEEVLGKTPRILKSGHQEPIFYQEMWETIQSGKVWVGTFKNLKKNGQFYEEQATISPIHDKDGKITHYVAIKRDITEKKELQQQLRQAQKMEAIGTLASGVAHDFNNILTSILGFTELTSRNVPEGSKEKENLKKVLKASNRAANLVSQILSFSHQKEQEHKPLLVSMIIKEAIKFLRAGLPTTVCIYSNIDESAIIKGDPTQIHQILMNLCINAAHSMRKKGGNLAIQTEVVSLQDQEIKELKAGEYLLLTISDTGHGIPEDIQEKIFQPYFTTKPKGKGTGLGLVTVKRIVNSHKGALKLTSTVGKGTTFEIYLPTIEEKGNFWDIEADPIPLRGSGKILFVDDEQSIVDMAKEMLEYLGYEVHSVMDSKIALGIFTKSPYDYNLVITDQTMPGITGIKLTQKLMKIRPDIPIVLCTGYSEEVDKETAAAMGIRAFVMKPLSMGNFSKILGDILNQP